MIKTRSVDLSACSVELCETSEEKLHRVPQSTHRVLKRGFVFQIFFILSLITSAQFTPQSIHYEQNEYYHQFGDKTAAFYDSINGFKERGVIVANSVCQLQRTVFGFHPYWAGSDYLNYQWNLISDFCYFSYEVIPNTGEPGTYHGWLTDPAIDSAQAHGVKTHLCATLFSGHSTFFTNQSARQTLITNLITLVRQRNANGVNMDIEAVPASLRDSITSFMRDLSVQLKAAIPGAFVSIDLPAVDWGHAFDVIAMDPYVDLFFVMAYDYYWNGSAQAGPVSPLYSLTSTYDYSLARTVSAYETAGVDKEKFILGVPYYGRQWKTQSNTIPSPILANGSALTYANVRNNSGTYNSVRYVWEQNSHSSCYIFFQNDNWNQCFIGLDRDLRKKYDLVNYRGLGGIGIWALGYDDGYPDLWQAISDKFSDCYIPLIYDTLYDSGGPAWNYYTNEEYVVTMDQGFNDFRHLSFSDFNLEEGYDSLWIYAGPDTTYAFLGSFSGNIDPGNFSSDNGAFTLRFKSDGLQNASGWMAVYHDGSLGIDEKSSLNSSDFLIYPNPAIEHVIIAIPDAVSGEQILIYNVTGKILYKRELEVNSYFKDIQLNISSWSAGVYSAVLIDKSRLKRTLTFIKLNK